MNIDQGDQSMRRSLFGFALSAAVAALGCVVMACPQPGSPEASRPKEPADLTTVSSVEPTPGKPLAHLEPLPNLPLVPSEGDCAPRYANGQMGTCINSKPCRGMGMRTPDGAVECRCWAKIGGCGEGERCDGVFKACVPETSPEFGRGRTD
jgi:hypothetical protein